MSERFTSTLLFENAFELFGDGGRINCPPDLDPRGDPVKVIVNQQQDYLWGCADFYDTNFTPSEAVTLLHAFSPQSDRLPVPPVEYVAEAITDLSTQSSIFRNSLDEDTREIVDFVARLPHFRRIVNGFSAWLTQENETVDEFSGVRLVEPGETDEMLPKILAGYHKSELLGTLGQLSLEIEGQTVEFTEELKDFLVAHPHYVRSLSGRTFTNPDTIWRQFTRLGRTRRNNILLDYLESLSPVDKESTQESILSKSTQRYNRITDSSGKQYLVNRSHAAAELVLSNLLTTYQVSASNPPTKPPTYSITRTAHHPRPTIRPTVCDSVKDTTKPSIGSALLGWATISLLERYTSSDSELALKRQQDHQPVIRAARHVALSVFFRVWEADIHAAALNQRISDYLQQS